MSSETTYKVRGKRNFLEAYMKNNFHVGNAAKAIDIPRRTIYKWMQEDPDFKQKIEDLYELSIEIQIEEAEVTHRRIRNGIPDLKKEKVNGVEVMRQVGWIEKPNVGAIEFYLKTKGRHKGYGDEYNPGAKADLKTKEEIIAEIERLNLIFERKELRKLKRENNRKNQGFIDDETQLEFPEAEI